MRIEAAVWREGSAIPTIEAVDLDAPRPDEVLVRIVATGVCHTDVRVASRPGGPRPIVLGHEGAGVIEQVGDGVEDLKVGQPVIMSYGFCGACGPCLHHAKAYCELSVPLNFSGLRADGSSPLSQGGAPIHGAFFGQSSFATHAVCAARSVIAAPADIPLSVLAPLGCGVQTGAGAIINSLKVSAGQSVVVFGTGSVGLSAVMAAKVMGAGLIVAVDVNPGRLRLALELGATDAIDASASDPLAEIRARTGHGADVVLNTTDVPAVYLQGIAALAPQGTFGFVTTPVGQLALDLRPLLLGGRRIQGIVQGDSESRVFLPKLIDLHRQGRFPLERLIEHYPFERIAEAMHDSEAGKTVKPVLVMAA